MTVSKGNTAPEIVDGVLQQLKVKLGEVDLFEALEKDFIHGYGIKALLKKFGIPDAPSKVVDFVVAFAPLFRPNRC